jgi:hypothetical protein
MAGKRTPCVVGAPRIYHYSTNIVSTLSCTRCTFRSQAHTSRYVCAQYNALNPRPTDERNNVYSPPQDQSLVLGFPLSILWMRMNDRLDVVLYVSLLSAPVMQGNRAES